MRLAKILTLMPTLTSTSRVITTRYISRYSIIPMQPQRQLLANLARSKSSDYIAQYLSFALSLII